jgi:hypothetical protein
MQPIAVGGGQVIFRIAHFAAVSRPLSAVNGGAVAKIP